MSDLPKGVYIRESLKKVMSGSKSVFFLDIRTIYLKNIALFFSRIHQHVRNQSYEEIN